MRLRVATLVISGLWVCLMAGPIWAGGARVIHRPHHFAIPHVHSPHYAPLIIVSPHGHWYLVAAPVVVNAPFFCLLHGVGFISRVGMIDHLSARHRFALETAAALCPQGNKSCLFPSYE